MKKVIYTTLITLFILLIIFGAIEFLAYYAISGD